MPGLRSKMKQTITCLSLAILVGLPVSISWDFELLRASHDDVNRDDLGLVCVCCVTSAKACEGDFDGNDNSPVLRTYIAYLGNIGAGIPPCTNILHSFYS